MRGAVGALVLVLLVVGSGAIFAIVPTHAPSTALSHSPAAVATEAIPAATHGDLVVASGQTYTIQPAGGSHTYSQGGNITVQAGGTLIVRNITLLFVEFVADTGTAESRLSHVLHFADAGTVNFYNSTLTTDVQLLNAYAKLNVSVTGTLSAWNTTFAFPGWVRATGAAAVVTFNGSTLEANPGVAHVVEPPVIQADTEYAPTVVATGGASVNFLGSNVTNTYADNFEQNGIPTPAPLNSTAPFTLPGSGNFNDTTLATSTDSANLTRDWGYPSGILGAQVHVFYNNTQNLSTSAGVTVWMNGKGYAFGTIDFGASTAPGQAFLNTSGGFVGALNAVGMLQYLNWTGSFGAGPLKFAIQFTGISGVAVPVSEAALVLLPQLSFDMTASGAGTTVAAVNTVLNLTWNKVPVSPFSLTSPVPWLSNKLVLTGGAFAYLANVTAPEPFPPIFSSSIVLPDAASQAYFYRWAEFTLTGRGGYLPIAAAQAYAFYAYNSNQLNNQTVAALNNLATTSPAIWGYVRAWDGLHGLPAYGETGRAGKAFLLLAAGNVTGPTLPDGIFLGTYHIGVTVPLATGNSKWFNWSVSAYPAGVANGSTGYRQMDSAPPISFPGYYSSLTVENILYKSNGTAITNTTGIAPGRVLSVDVPLQNTGTADIYNLTGVLWYGGEGTGTAVTTFPFTNVSVAPGGTAWVNFTWLVTSTVTGIDGSVNQLFTANITYNGGTPALGGAYVVRALHLTVQRYFADLTATSVSLLANGSALPKNTVRIGQALEARVNVTYSGTVTLTQFAIGLYYSPPNATSKPLASAVVNKVLNVAPTTVPVWLNWTVNDSVTGLEGATFLHAFYVEIVALYSVENFSTPLLVIVDHNSTVNVSVAPSQVRIVSLNTPPTTLDPSQSYLSFGYVQYNGSERAELTLYALPTSGGAPIPIAAVPSYAGNYSMPWYSLSGYLSAGSSYHLSLHALYNGVTAYYNLTEVFSVPSSSTSPQGFLYQTFLGLPLLYWLAIAGAIVVAIALVLVFSRRGAAGKLVECGECGNLIPEEATVCPKCGAEFESDLIRCSRCASTIPANSQYCPECAAQLLGKPGEGADDPERQGYADFTERYRSEAKKELGENYTEGSFWDWWKRQPTYTPFSQWKLQQGQSVTRAGMAAPPVGTQTLSGDLPTTSTRPLASAPPRGGARAAPAAPAAAPADAMTAPPAAAPAPAGGALKPCPNCGKEIPPEYLVCPFCGSVTQ